MSPAQALSGLFLSAFVAATLVPAGSEVALAALILAGGFDVWALVAVATLGNVLGSVVNYALGRVAHRFAGRRWFPVAPEALGRAEGWYRRWGRWSLLLSWVPVVGDPITVAAGLLRERPAVFLILVTLAKGGRYAALAAAVG
jgi:membrane protein YqaA with SNARE-associated domain